MSSPPIDYPDEMALPPLRKTTQQPTYYLTNLIFGMSNEGETEEREDLLNARLALEPPDVLHNLIDILRGDAFDLRHVAEFPMVRLDAVGRSPVEGRIPVMIRLIDLMYQRRSVVGAHGLLPMTGRTVDIECGFACLELGRHRTTPDRWLGLRGIAGHQESQYQQPCSDLRS